MVGLCFSARDAQPANRFNRLVWFSLVRIIGTTSGQAPDIPFFMHCPIIALANVEIAGSVFVRYRQCRVPEPKGPLARAHCFLETLTATREHLPGSILPKGEVSCARLDELVLVTLT